MLEIVLLVWMCRYVNRVAGAKGYPGWAFAVAMGGSWVGFGVGGAILGAVGELSDGRPWGFGWAVGYVFGVALACGLNAVAVNLLAEQPTASQGRAVSAASEEQEYVAWRKRQLPQEKRVEEGEAEPAVVVDLAPADATPPPVARRVWARKWG